MIDLSVLRNRIDDLEKTVSEKEQESMDMKRRIAALEIWIPGRRTPEKSSAVDTVQKTLKVALGKIHERTLTFDARFDDATEVVTWVFGVATEALRAANEEAAGGIVDRLNETIRKARG